MSDKIKNIIKLQVKNLINEDDTNVIRKGKSVTGDQSSSRLAKSSVAIDKIKDNLRSMGVSPSEVDNVYTIDQLSAMAFDFDFKILASEFSQWDQNVVLYSKQHRARVNKDLSGQYNTLVLDLDNGWDILFNPKELSTNIPGTDTEMRGLKNDQKYKIKLGGTFNITDLDPEMFDCIGHIHFYGDVKMRNRLLTLLEASGDDLAYPRHRPGFTA
jgi:hypothetical protein